MARQGPGRDRAQPAPLDALLALTHVSAQDPAHRDAGRPGARPGPQATGSSRRSTGSTGTRSPTSSKLDLLRVYQVVFNRFGRPDDATAARLIARLRPALSRPRAAS